MKSKLKEPDELDNLRKEWAKEGRGIRKEGEKFIIYQLPKKKKKKK